MTFYPEMADTAASLLADLGQTVTLTRVVSGGYNPDTGQVDPDVEQTQEVRAVVLPYKQGDYLAAGGMLRQGDRRVLISPDVEWVPDAATKLEEVTGAVWQLESVDALAPAGVTVLYQGNATR